MKKTKKDKEVVIDHADPKPKKKSKSLKTKKKKPRSVESAKKKIAKRKQVIATMEASLPEVIPASDGEAEYLKEYLYMFRRLKKLIRKAEKQCQKSGASRDYYALSTLLSQQREVIADLRTITDMSGQVQLILDQVLMPLVKNIGQNILDIYYQKRKLMMETCKPNEVKFAMSKLEELTKDQAKFVQEMYKASEAKLNELLLSS